MMSHAFILILPAYFGFADRCEAGLCPAVNVISRFRALPAIVELSSDHGRSPILSQRSTGGAQPRLTSGGEAVMRTLKIW